MDISMLGESKYLGREFVLHGLVGIVNAMILSNKRAVFTHTDVVSGGESSIRAFSFEPLSGFITLPQPSGANQIVYLLLEFSNSLARYRETTQRDAMKGWEFREIEVEGKPVLTAEAVWIQPSS